MNAYEQLQAAVAALAAEFPTVSVGEPQLATHGEGNRYGNLAYVLSFIRAFLFELQDWRRIPDRRVDGSPQGE